MTSKTNNLALNTPNNPFANAVTLEEREAVWNKLKKSAQPISREEFLKKLKEAGSK